MMKRAALWPPFVVRRVAMTGKYGLVEVDGRPEHAVAERGSRQMTASDGQRVSLDELRGLKGWLLVLLGFQILVLLREFFVLMYVGTFYVEGLRIGAWGPLSVVHLGRILINGAFVVLLGYVIALMVGRRRTFVHWFKIEMMFFMLLPFIEIGWIVVAPWSGPAFVSLRVLLPLGLSLALGLAWWLYVERSIRVRATFAA